MVSVLYIFSEQLLIVQDVRCVRFRLGSFIYLVISGAPFKALSSSWYPLQYLAMSQVVPALSLYRRILQRFPRNVAFCFAYGSGVKSQLGYDRSKIGDNVLDFIIAVEDSQLPGWHNENIARNSKDYSGLGRLGGDFVTKFQRSIPANVYFNTLVPLPKENVTIKYGVVAETDMVRDCTNWKYLYLAGRLQKPVTIVSQNVPEHINEALRLNLSQALSTALLLLPARFTDYDLFYRIAQLSYRGDFRMVFGENPNKVQNIVRPQLAGFLNLYQEQISSRSKVLQLVSPVGSLEQTFEVDKSPESVLALMHGIPKSYQRNINVTEDYRAPLANSIALTVFKSSAIQSIKNIPTAGILKAIRYSYSKAKKTFS